TPVLSVLDEVRAEMQREESSKPGGGGWIGEAFRELTGAERKELAREAVSEAPPLAGLSQDKWASYCVRSKHPESLKELLALFGARAIPRMAPYGSWADGAAASAAQQRRAMGSSSVPGSDGTGAAYGTGPLVVNDPRYPEVNGLGLVHD